jgi:hypothetical protein
MMHISNTIRINAGEAIRTPVFYELRKSSGALAGLF